MVFIHHAHCQRKVARSMSEVPAWSTLRHGPPNATKMRSRHHASLGPLYGTADSGQGIWTLHIWWELLSLSRAPPRHTTCHTGLWPCAPGPIPTAPNASCPPPSNAVKYAAGRVVPGPSAYTSGDARLRRLAPMCLIIPVPRRTTECRPPIKTTAADAHPDVHSQAPLRPCRHKCK